MWSLADALLGADPAAALRLYLELRGQGERVPGLIYWMSQRVRTAHEVAGALEAGQPASQIKRELRMPSRAADRLIADAGRAGSERLRRAIGEIADLELASRGGGPVAHRGQRGAARAAPDRRLKPRSRAMACTTNQPGSGRIRVSAKLR